MRIDDLLLQASLELSKCGIVEHELDARILLESCLYKTRTELYLDSNGLVSEENEHRYRRWIARRKCREPVAYILGEQEFWSLPFFVSPAVLIPRPETEFLIDRVLQLADRVNFSKGSILDLCCGSGVIATVLAKESGQPIIAADISSEALTVVRKNSRRHEVEHLVLPVQSNLFSAFSAQKTFSLIITNPPYVSSFDVNNTLEPEVAEHEPRLALDGGAKGLEIIREIALSLPAVLLPGGQVFMEIGADQGDAVRKMFNSNKDAGEKNYTEVMVLTDYTGRDRVLCARITD